jgi:hypothetical protein
MPRRQLTTQERNWTFTRDLALNRSTVSVIKDDGTYRLPEIDLDVRNAAYESYEIEPGRPYSATGRTRWIRGFARGDWAVRTETRTVLRADAESFIIDAELDAYESDRRVFAENYHHVIPRDHV